MCDDTTVIAAPSERILSVEEWHNLMAELRRLVDRYTLAEVKENLDRVEKLAAKKCRI